MAAVESAATADRAEKSAEDSRRYNGRERIKVREREDAFTSTRDARATLGFWWRGGFCGFAGFRRCAACGCWTTGKIFVRGCEDIVLDE